MSKKQIKILEIENKKLQQTQSLSDQDLTKYKKEWEQERNSFQEKILELEKEKASLKAKETISEEKIAKLKEDKEKLEKELAQHKDGSNDQASDSELIKTYQETI